MIAMSLDMPWNCRLLGWGVNVSPVDLLAAVAVAIGLLRGLFLGLVREAFSLGSIAAACMVASFFMLVRVRVERSPR